MNKRTLTIFSIVIFIAHIALLYWMLYVLKNAGMMTFNVVMAHFVGLAIFGSSLIITTALGTKYFQKKEWKLKNFKK